MFLVSKLVMFMVAVIVGWRALGIIRRIINATFNRIEREVIKQIDD